MKSRVVPILAFLLLVALFAAGVHRAGYRAALDQIARRGTADLALASDRLVNQLQRYRELAVLLAGHPTLVPAIDGQAGAASELLLSIRDKTAALDILVLDSEGRERASALGLPPRDHGGRGYFERAMDGALGMSVTESDRWARRGFVFAAPVFSEAGPVRGSLVVIADLEAVEQAWRGDRPTVYFTDSAGVVYVSNRSELVLTRKGGADFIAHSGRDIGGHDVWRVDGGPYIPARALHLTLGLPVIGMTGEALIDVAPALAMARLQAAAAAAICLAFGALVFVLLERRRTLAEANARLEARVEDRTVALRRLNADLRREVAERAAAEGQLKKAQADLVQAGKLSALGQMSAGISHELNQPLMAIRSFAENGGALLERGRTDSAARNLERIGELARRMGRIIRNLRAFARQESEAPGEVDLVTAIEAALEMSAARARQADVAIRWDPPEDVPPVIGGEVRLQQVILNLVGNAIDAMEIMDGEKRVEIGVSREGRRVLLSVRDTGPGIAEPEKIFDPFYTTKQVGDGEGMGLGLSISYGLVQSFGGMIRGANHPEGGAVFTVELEAARGAGGGAGGDADEEEAA